jgi:xanthine dehydrogenase accessory factor
MADGVKAQQNSLLAGWGSRKKGDEMENVDVMVLRALTDWRLKGLRAVLVTVTRTWGSSPRPVGSIMALCEDSSVMGSVSGGCIEDDLIQRYTRSYLASSGASSALGEQLDGPPKQLKYGISADEAHRFGLPCGGTLELLLEFNPDALKLTELVKRLETGELVTRDTRIDSGEVSLTPCLAPKALEINGERLSNTFGPEYRMLIIGAGQMSEYLATMALFNGFSVTVCDPRQEYSSGWSLAKVQVTQEMPDDVVMSFKPDRRTCVIALTHDPKLDDLALIEALSSEAFYIGAIGSRKNNQARQNRMIEHFDQTPESLMRLRGPIGLFIGSKTPAEIAVSIMAEVLAVKNEVVLPKEMNVAQAKNLMTSV